jgi:hypothetical protein
MQNIQITLSEADVEELDAAIAETEPDSVTGQRISRRLFVTEAVQSCLASRRLARLFPGSPEETE